MSLYGSLFRVIPHSKRPNTPEWQNYIYIVQGRQKLKSQQIVQILNMLFTSDVWVILLNLEGI
jgi:hypothetical protein